MCDQLHVSVSCPACDTCDYTKTWGDFPVHTVDNKNGMEYYCIIFDKRCVWYYDKDAGRSIRNFEKGITGALPKENTNNNTNTQSKNNNQSNNNKAPAKAPAKAPETPKPNTNTNTKPNTNTVNNNKANTTGNTVPKGNTNTAATTNNAVNTNTQVNAPANANTAPNANAGTIIATDATKNNENINASDPNATNATNGADKLKYVGENGTSNNEATNSNVASNDVNTTNNSNIIDGNGQNRIGDDGGVSPYVIGSLSFFTILLIVVGFLYVKKRKNQKEEDVDPIYRNSSVFFATPIVAKRNSQESQRSIGSKLSANNKTAISSADDGDFDIVISPTNAGTAALTTNNETVQSQSQSQLQQAPGPIQTYANTSIFEDNSVSGINVSSSENFINQSNINYNTTSVVTPSMYPQTTVADTSNVVVPNTMPGDVSEDIISPLVPTTVNQNVTVQNASFLYEFNDYSTHDPSVSFINSTNGISFIKSKDESCMLSPIMDKSVSNVFTADMVTENSINVDLKQLTSTPKLNNSRGKKTLSMVISEYKEDTIYAAKFNYDPSMEDEMRIRINDRVLVKEIFNDGWAYGENKTSDSFGIFPINRLDSSS